MLVDLDQLLTTKEAAALLGLKKNTLELWRHQGKGPPYLKLVDTPFGPIRYERSKLMEWLRTRSFTSTSASTVAARERQTA